MSFLVIVASVTKLYVNITTAGAIVRYYMTTEMKQNRLYEL